jgi:hypothetical protein
MGTRSLVHIKNGDISDDTLVTIYRQYDGYPEGMAFKLFEILNNGDTQILNGFCSQESPAFFNGMGCLAAWVVSKLKKEIGNVYLYPVNAEDVDEEYTYTIYKDETFETLMLMIDSNYLNNIQFPITAEGYKAFNEWLTKREEERNAE